MVSRRVQVPVILTNADAVLGDRLPAVGSPVQQKQIWLRLSRLGTINAGQSPPPRSHRLQAVPANLSRVNRRSM
jgi:hypothetical protein